MISIYIVFELLTFDIKLGKEKPLGFIVHHLLHCQSAELFLLLVI